MGQMGELSFKPPYGGYRDADPEEVTIPPLIDDARLTDLGIPRRVRRVLSAPLQATTSIRAVDAWLTRPRHKASILLLLGSKGTGKTVAAGHWFMAEASRPINRIRCWYTAIELMRVGLYGDRLEAIKRLPFLAIDDLGNEFHDAKGAFDVLLYDVLNHRYDEELRTLVTGNMPWDGKDRCSGFVQRYDSRLVDRILECGDVVHCTGDSLRRKPDNVHQPVASTTEKAE